MEKTQAKKSTKANPDQSAKIKEAYIEYVLENGHEPASVFQFMKSLKMKESVFYDYYNSFTALQKEIWKGFFDQAVQTIESDEVFRSYSVREKLLAFYYTWIEVLKNNRSYIIYCWQDLNAFDRNFARNQGEFLTGFKSCFIDFVNELINEGKESNEVADRPLISNNYDKILWQQLLFILNFWVKDDSKGFEKTDAAIEKAVNLSFDIMGRGAWDAAVDFARFLYQTR